MNKHLLASIVFLALLGGCSSGGNQVQPAGPVPKTPIANPVQSRSTGALATATFVIRIPTHPDNLRAAYISSATKSIAISANGGAPITTDVASGQSTYTIKVKVAPGDNTFSVTLFDGTGGTGNPLAQGTVTAPVTEAQDNPIDMELGGVVASIELFPDTTEPAIGIPNTIQLGIVARDAAGHQIIGPYSNRIDLTDSDTSTNTLALSISPSPEPPDSPTTVADSMRSVAINYDGVGRDSEQFCASAGSAQACVTITPILAVQAVAVSPTSTTIATNGTTTLAALVTLSDGTSVDGVGNSPSENGINWTSSNTGIATVNNSGVVTGIASGSVSITATSSQNPTKSGTATVTVLGPVVVSPASLAFYGDGDPLTFTATQAEYTGNFTAVTPCTAANGTTVATVSPATSAGEFTVTSVAAGACTLTVTGGLDQSASVSIKVTTTSLRLR